MHPARVLAVDVDSPWYEDVIAFDARELGREVKPASDTHWFAAVEGDALCAYAAGRVLWPGTFMLTRAVTTPEHRGRGLQGRLIRARVALARRLGCVQVVTYTAHDNVASMRALIKAGFLPYRARGGEFWMGPAWVHWRRLTLVPKRGA